jgi:hypothetical protein
MILSGMPETGQRRRNSFEGVPSLVDFTPQILDTEGVMIVRQYPNRTYDIDYSDASPL